MFVEKHKLSSLDGGNCQIAMTFQVIYGWLSCPLHYIKPNMDNCYGMWLILRVKGQASAGAEWIVKVQ